MSFPSFLEFLVEDVEIANNDIYLLNMSKSFNDKAWFLKHLPDGITTIVDFGGGAGEFAEYCQHMTNNKIKYVIIDNNKAFLSTAMKKGFLCFTSLPELLAAKDAIDLSHALLNLSSVIHEIYSYADEFYDDIGVFWTDVKKCGFKAIAIRDMSLNESAYKTAPIDAILWTYQHVFKSDIQYKGKTFNEITSSFEDVWGNICDVEAKKVNIKQLIHFLIKYRYQENWEREVRENYLPVTQAKLQKWLTSYMGYSLSHKESSHLEFYDKCWTKDFKLNIPDNGNYKAQFKKWLSTLSTHIKWLAEQ